MIKNYLSIYPAFGIILIPAILIALSTWFTLFPPQISYQNVYQMLPYRKPARMNVLLTGNLELM
jgi:hypothetical protein